MIYYYIIIIIMFIGDIRENVYYLSQHTGCLENVGNPK